MTFLHRTSLGRVRVATDAAVVRECCARGLLKNLPRAILPDLRTPLVLVPAIRRVRPTGRCQTLNKNKAFLELQSTR
jgi:hypothetical protein